jgi:succinoglycan biosynthesis transport protein ExoP
MREYMQQDIDISISDLFRFIRRGLIWALLLGAAAGGLAYYYGQNQELYYRASATVIAAQNAPDFRPFGVSPVVAPSLDASAYRAAVLSDPVMTDALASMGVAEPSAQEIRRLRRNTSVRTEIARDSSLVYITTTESTPEAAATSANKVAEALVNWDKWRATRYVTQAVEIIESKIEVLEEEIRALQVAGGADAQTQIEGLTRQLADQQSNLSNARVMLLSSMPRLEVLDPAAVPTTPITGNIMLNTALAFVLGVMLVYGLLLLRAALDTRLRGTEDLARVSGLPVLAEFPKLTRGSRRLPAEASSYLRTNLLFATADAHPKVILVTSARMTEGKSSVALSVAESFARNDYRTLLVDGDLRKPVIADEYKLDPKRHPSFRTYLENPHKELEPAHVAINLTQRLSVIPTFQAVNSPAELLSRGFRECLERWRHDYDVIIIDSAPVLAVADTLTIAPFCTGTVLVASQQSSDRRQVRAAVELLQRLGVRTLGVAATHVSRQGGQSAGYGYGYGYGPATGDTTANPPPVVTAPAMKLPRNQGRSDAPVRPINRS